MLWIILFGLVGCVAGVLVASKRNFNLGFGVFSGIIGCFVGLAFCAVCEFSMTIPETAHVANEIDAHKIAVSDEGEIIYLDVKTDRGETIIYYMSPDGRTRSINYDEVKVEYSDNNFRVAHTKTVLTGWYYWLTLTQPKYQTTIYVPRELWIRKFPAR